jgi:hypothetical protein
MDEIQVDLHGDISYDFRQEMFTLHATLLLQELKQEAG